MTPSQVISLVADHFVLAGSTDSTNVTWRKRILERLQETAEEIRDADSWYWKQDTAEATVAVGDLTFEGPANFIDIGENGGLYIAGQQHRLEEVPPHDLFRMQEMSSGNGRPEFYCVSFAGGSEGPLINFNVACDQAYTFTLYYDTAPNLLMDAPTACVAAEGAAGNPNGTYTYRISFVNSDGTNSDQGAVSNSITVALKKISLSSIPVGGPSHVIARSIYRTIDSGAEYKLVATINDNTTTTYTDNIADGSLGDGIVETQSLEIPRAFHRSVVAKGVKAKVAKDLERPDAPQYEAEYRAELARMKARRVPGSESLQRLGDFGLPTYGMH